MMNIWHTQTLPLCAHELFIAMQACMYKMATLKILGLGTRVAPHIACEATPLFDITL